MKKIFVYLTWIFIFFSALTIAVLMIAEEKSFTNSVFITLMLFTAGEPLNLNLNKIELITGTLMVIQAAMGLMCVTVGFSVIVNYLVSEKISRLMAREKIKMKDHIIICGLGNVGYQIAKELSRLEQDFVIIDRGDDKDLVEVAKKRKCKVLIENLKNSDSLHAAQIEHAKSMIICTGNDLLNMEVALMAREIREDIIIVMRMFDQDLAKKVKNAFGLKIAFSASGLSASVFAAASIDQAVFQSVRVDKELFVSAKLRIENQCDIIGMTLDELMAKDLVVLKLISGKERLKFPRGDRQIQLGDIVYVTCSLPVLKEIKKLVDNCEVK